jgi:hypothetical protein
MKRKHSAIEKMMARVIHECRTTVKLEELEEAVAVRETELKDLGEFNTVDSLYKALWDEPEADFRFERELNRATTGQTIMHRGVVFTILRVEPVDEAKTIAIELPSGASEYVCKLNNVCTNKLMLTIN